MRACVHSLFLHVFVTAVVVDPVICSALFKGGLRSPKIDKRGGDVRFSTKIGCW